MPAASRRFAFAPSGADPSATVFVDGTEPGFRSLSHWPGNSTPAALRHDLSTGIALRWAALSPAERDALLGPFSVCANNHYDTDGALSCFAVMRPEAALPRADLMLRAAATGDFSTWNGPDALAVELSVMALPRHPASPLAAALPAGADDARRRAAAYDWLIEHLPDLLDAPFGLERMWSARHARIVEQVEAVEDGRLVEVQALPALDLAVVTTSTPLTTIGLHHAARDRYRVLLVHAGDDGARFRLVYRDESWFDLETIAAAPRVPLGPLAAALQAREEAAGVPRGAWWASDLEVPVAMLGFGDPDRAPDGFSDDPDLAADPPSRLDAATVLELVTETLAAG